jgi:mono/diheme cytochrome c family protein
MRSGKCTLFAVALVGLWAAVAPTSQAGDAIIQKLSEDFHPGYRHLLESSYVPGEMDQEVFDNLWQSWEEPLKSTAAAASPAERRQMTLSRYGLMDAPGREGGVPLQYTDDGSGKWASNCFLCHGGKVAGKVIPGLPNTHIALATLSEETLKTKRLLGRKISFVEQGVSTIPLGGSIGTTNAIIFGVLLGNYRDKDLNVDLTKPLPKMVHNDHDAPPWWHYKRKDYLYADGFAGKGHRALMQFMMTPANGPQVFHDSEEDFKQIQDFIASIQPPKYPYAIDDKLADQGETVFNRTCSECHGTYGENADWPGLIIPVDVVGTDRARLDSLTPDMRASYEEGWFSNYGEKKAVKDPGGYIAQPLDGIWASAPYLHNGSVPTLYHLFYPNERPIVWQRTEDGYDQEKIGLEVTAYDELPEGVTTDVQKRTYFDTRNFAKSAEGHLFPDQLNDDEKKAVLEYLKTL